ncbi:MAG: hypothetical protein VW683_00040 [Betaproteobacteria bacterium]|jgi:hypothetical protein
METLFLNLFRNSGQPLALYLYRRVAKPHLQAVALDATLVATIAQDFIAFGTSTTEEGAALEQVVLDQVKIGAPNATVQDIAGFMVKLGEELAVDYPAA